jgi:hypothetical protein
LYKSNAGRSGAPQRLLEHLGSAPASCLSLGATPPDANSRSARPIVASLLPIGVRD